jgi:hypothetical protein
LAVATPKASDNRVYLVRVRGIPIPSVSDQRHGSVSPPRGPEPRQQLGRRIGTVSTTMKLGSINEGYTWSRSDQPQRGQLRPLRRSPSLLAA